MEEEAKPSSKNFKVHIKDRNLDSHEVTCKKRFDLMISGLRSNYLGPFNQMSGLDKESIVTLAIMI